MTAEELINRDLWAGGKGGPITKGSAILLMQTYAKIKCAEQRKICAEHAEGYVNEFSCEGPYAIVDHSSILNAPEPKFD
jgi:hypothetical protein